MAIQGAVAAIVTMKEESSMGVAAGATGAQRLRRVSSSLNLKKAAFASNEARPDQQVADLRHGLRSVTGGLEMEVALVSGGETMEALLAAALRGSWVAGVSCAPADFATGVTIADSGDNSTLTFAGTGNLLTKGFRLGDIVRCTGLGDDENNGVNLRIVALTSTVMTVYPQITAAAQQASSWAVAVAGGKLLMGTTKRSFTIEQSYADAGVYELFTGCRVNSLGINAQPNAMATASFDFMGLDGAILDAAYFTLPTAPTAGGTLAGTGGALRVAGRELGVVTGIQLNVQNNLSQPPVIGAVVAPDILYGRMVATGSVTALLDGPEMLEAFDDEDEVDIVAVLEGAGAEPQDFYAINIQRAKFMDSSKTIGPDGAVILQMPFQALLPSDAAASASSLVIQRSTTVA